MRVLALDTATETGSITLLEEDTLLAQTQLRVERTHSQSLWRAIRFLLSETGWVLEQVDLWAVSTGPGSFTGVRIGMATIKGLAWVTQKPVIGVSTLEVLAWSVAPTSYLICPILDARRQEVYFAFYRQAPGGSLLRVREPGHGSPLGLCQEIREPAVLLGNGVRPYREVFSRHLGSNALIPEAWMHPLSGLALAGIALKRFRQGAGGPVGELRPLYLRSAEAEFSKKSLLGKNHALESRP
jgi:tRNA threonylcarbamoyladenosine biosynthesis protein TsaB